MQTPITIDRDVPLPEPRSNRTIYPFRQMEVGDSFSLPYHTRIANAAFAFGKINGLKFTTAKVGDMIRVWRVA